MARALCGKASRVVALSVFGAIGTAQFAVASVAAPRVPTLATVECGFQNVPDDGPAKVVGACGWPAVTAHREQSDAAKPGSSIFKIAPDGSATAPRSALNRLASESEAGKVNATSSRPMAPPGPGKDPTRDQVFRALILKRLAAHSSGDPNAYRRLLADDFIHVDDAGTRRSADQLSVYNGQDDKARWELGELHSRLLGQIAIVDCDEAEFLRFGPRELRFPYHETDIFVFRNGKWLFLQHAETRSLIQPTPPQFDSATLDDYVGRYDWWPGYSEIFTRKGNTLYQNSTDDSLPTAMRQVTKESFSKKGDPSLVFFVRDANGIVTQEVVHDADGQVFVARKAMAAN